MLEEESDNNNSDNALTLNLHAYTYEASPCSSKELYIDSGAENNGESLILQSRKRKRSEEEIEDGESDDGSEEETDLDMPDVVHQMEAEIERQLDAKSKKTNLTVANVKNILKDVITNEHVLELVRRTMKQPESNFCINKVFTYAPKLTRAKTRELLNTFPAMAWPITPSKNISTSKCKVLIEQELPEDSSDEEYRPDEDDDDEHDDTENPVQDLDNENKELEEEGEQVESDDVDSIDDIDDVEEDDDEDDEEDDDDDDDEEHASGDTIDLPIFKESDPKFSKTEIQVQGDEDDDEDRLVICDYEGEDHDSDNTPIEKYMEDNQNSTKNMFINDTGTQTQWLEKVVKATEKDMISLPDFSENNATNEENICQRTRSKLSLSDTPLEAIESAFMPPDITTDMYDSECDDEDWKNFLKGFTQPMKDSTQDADDDEEIDPEYNIMAEEEDADDKEELREDRGVMVSRKEVNDLMAELFEYIGMLDSDDCEVASTSKSNDKICETFEHKNNSDELKDIADHIAGVLEEHTIRSRPTSKSNDNKICETFEHKNNSDELNDIADHIAGVLQEHTEGSLQKSAVPYEDHQTNPINPNLFCTPNHIFNNSSVNEGDIFSSKTEGFSDSSHIVERSMSRDQLLLFKQQMRQYVQLRTQHFLLSYLHPLFHMYSMDCKQNLLLLKNLANSNKDSAYNADNLDGAIDLIKHWELTHSSEHSKKVYMDFFDKEIEIQNIMKRRKQFHRGEFPPEFLETVSNSNVFIYPLLLPLNPFRCDGPSVTRFFRSEDNLIALGLEHFTKYAQKNPKVMGKSTVPKFAPMIVEHFLPARRPSSVYTRILDCSKVDNNPIQYFLQKKCAPKTIHYVIPHLGAWLPPCKQPLDLLPYVWRNYVIETQNNKNGSGNTN